MEEQVLFAIAWGLCLAGIAVLASLVSDAVSDVRAARRVAQVLAEREEYRPMIHSLLGRARLNGGEIPISDHEEIDLREHVRRASIHVAPKDRERIEGGLFAYSVRAREVYLRRVLYASMQRLQHQS